MHASSQRPKMHKSARSRLRHAGKYGDMRTGPHQVLTDTLKELEGEECRLQSINRFMGTQFQAL